MNSLAMSCNTLSVDKFIEDNMLTEEDLDLDPALWQDISCDSAESSSDHSDGSCCHNSSACSYKELNGMTPPDTPPSSDRSTPPPDLNDLTLINTIASVHCNAITPVTVLPTPQLFPSFHTTTQISPPLPLSNVITGNAIVQVQPPASDSSINAIKSPDRRLSTDKHQISQLKKEARKLRNRQASIASRKRKQEYLDGLTGQVNSLMKENALLRAENSQLLATQEQLKNRIAFLEKELDQTLKKSVTQGKQTNGNKKTLSLLAVIVMIGFNLAPYSGILSVDSGLNNDKTLRITPVKQGVGRSLLWISEKPETNSSKQIEQLFANFTNLLLNKEKSTNRSVEDRCVYEYAKSAVNCLLQGDALNKSNLLACVVEQTFARNSTDKRVQRKQIFRFAHPFFHSNRASVRGLQGLHLFHRNYLSKRLVNNEISSFNGPDSEEYQLLLERFRYLFCWPDFEPLIERPDEDASRFQDQLKQKFAPYPKSFAKTRSIYANATNKHNNSSRNNSMKKVLSDDSSSPLMKNVSNKLLDNRYRNSSYTRQLHEN